MQRVDNGNGGSTGSDGTYFDEFFCASKLNLVDKTKAQKLTSSEAVPVFRGRYRGYFSVAACFVFYRKANGEELLHIQPEKRACSPEALAAKLQETEENITILAIGFVSDLRLEATRLEITRESFEDLVARSFGANHKSDVSLEDYRNAKIMPQGMEMFRFVESYGLAYCHPRI
jgi:hypothetical protein